MPDEIADDSTAPAESAQRRRTVAEVGEVADNAMGLAAAVDEQLDEMSAKLTDHATRIQDGEAAQGAFARDLLRVREELHEEIVRTGAGQGDPVSHTLAEDHLADQIDAAIERQLAGMTITAPTAAELPNILARLEAAERQLAQGEGSPSVSATVHTLADNTNMGAAVKVLELMRLVAEIPKSKQADLGKGGKFMFRGVDDAMDAVGNAMRQVGLILSPMVLSQTMSHNTVKIESTNQGRTTVRDTIWTTVQVHMSYTFLDPLTGSTHAVEMLGEGRDAGDKATSKAAAMALKYALLHGLMIPIEGMPDSDAENPQLTSERTHENDIRAETSRETYEGDPYDVPPVGTTQRPAAEDKADPAQHGRAVEALAAIRAIEGLAPAERLARLTAIGNQVEIENLGGHVVDGATLRQHGLAMRRTLVSAGGE